MKLGKSIAHQTIFFTVTILSLYIASNAKGNILRPNNSDLVHRVLTASPAQLDDIAASIIVNQRLKPLSAENLRRVLERSDSEARAQFVALLVKIGLQMDTPTQGQRRVIRDSNIIKMLMIEGFAKRDRAAAAARRALLHFCRPEDLFESKEIIINSLKAKNPHFLLIAAKAKALDSLPMVIALAADAEMDEQQIRHVQIAQAALGDTDLESRFLAKLNTAIEEAPPAPKNDFYDVGAARDGKHVVPVIETLGLIGTKKSLAVLCPLLRSDLKTYWVNEREESVRYAVVEALRYNFPDEGVLSSPRLNDRWNEIESFCASRLGVSFTGPTPEKPLIFSYPHD
ncbi:hypothetical protein KY495_18690 [Massilia sp. PAMC28688]|uniref:hypothetical protein n=1 Tax=Massilia sp. PAMC28688 TaxID=2861283 RepID=UPI001C626CF0|nr:hypothetical protein [Massilia sp. PAMC28688]QYF92738.1 hypothetical protein KY495_18690 [Massilia sp. PAMC28688]